MFVACEVPEGKYHVDLIHTVSQSLAQGLSYTRSSIKHPLEEQTAHWRGADTLNCPPAWPAVSDSRNQGPNKDDISKRALM